MDMVWTWLLGGNRAILGGDSPHPVLPLLSVSRVSITARVRDELLKVNYMIPLLRLVFCAFGVLRHVYLLRMCLFWVLLPTKTTYSQAEIYNSNAAPGRLSKRCLAEN